MCIRDRAEGGHECWSQRSVSIHALCLQELLEGREGGCVGQVLEHRHGEPRGPCCGEEAADGCVDA
eukprot:14295444-Heterocapsa_arctica.AAC.1